MEKEKKLRALCHTSEDISACDDNTSFYNCLRNYYNQAYMNSAMLIEMFHGLVSTLMMIFIHQPYREAFLKMFFKRTPKHSLHKSTRVVQRVGSRPQS